MLNQKNTFDLFVVGDHNNFTFAAAKAVADAPGKTYNPLFIHGGNCCDNSHLLHAIGQHVFKKKKGARVACLTAEQFTNEYIEAIQNIKLRDFREKYLQTDVLLIDEVEFLVGKTRIQEEFFHTFLLLHEAQIQIVLAGNCSCEEIREIESRLVSRFEWGLVAEMSQTDSEARLAIS